MAEQSGSIQYQDIKVEAMLLYAQVFPLDIYINLSEEKYLKIVHKSDDALDIVEKYYKKGVRTLYVDREEFHQFTAAVRAHLKAKIEEEKENEVPETSDLKKAKYLSGARDVLKSIYDQGNVDDEATKLAKAIAHETVVLIGKSNIFERFEQFKRHCSEEYLYATVSAYLCSLMIDMFNWGNEAIKEKCALAILLSDIMLTPKEFAEMKAAKGDPDKLSSRVKNHPTETARQLAEDSKFISSETLKIIEQHHEMPNGKGYPSGLNYQSVTVLTCITIIATYFVERMFDENYKSEFARDRAATLVEQISNKFVNGNFRKASEALAKIYEEAGGL